MRSSRQSLRIDLGALLLMAVGIAHAQTSTKYYYYTDPQGTPLAKADAQGNIVERYEYTPYGTPVPSVSTAPNGPSYTGHVSDPETGLVYMQGRYYDPTITRFLSPDPVMPSAGNPFNSNRFAYANNNPIINIDPDGRVVKYAYANGATKNDRIATMNYLSSPPTARHEISQLKNSKQIYTILFDNNQESRYDDKSRTVIINPQEGIVVKSTGKIQSPAIGGGHEISHGAEHDRRGTGKFIKNLEAPVVSSENTLQGGVRVTFGVSPEEKRATEVEGKIANELGDNGRKDYLDSEKGSVKTCGPTSTVEC